MKQFNVLKNKLFSIPLFLCLILISGHSISEQALDNIIAIVNDDVITQNELDSRIADFIVQLKLDKNSKEQMKALSKQVLERLISTRIQLQMATQMGMTIDDISLNRMIEKIAQSNNITLSKLKNTLAKDGISFDRFREQTREDLIIKQLQQRMVANKINISDQEIQRFIDTNLNKNNENAKYQLQHILIATPESAKPDDIKSAKQMIDSLYQQIKNGANFKTLAIEQSNGRNALKGGELGWRTGSELPEAFLAAIKDISKGETSTPIRSASGFHILKLIDSSTSNNMVTQTLARHILIRTSKQRSDNDARKFLNQLKQQILQGEDFAKIAGEHSQDPGSKIKGGDLGWANPGTYVKEFEEVMGSLKKNAISEPFRSQFGWHILQVLDRRKQDNTEANLKSQASMAIHKRKYDEELRLWIRRIRDEAFVEFVGNVVQ